ncbi:MAG: PAS domain S-box protein [Spirochaetales bacterium]|nr:PAS domain S-box protein [Spirochaetales bacterium]
MANGIQRNILLVEDEAIIALHEKSQLESYGYSVHTVLKGEEAVARIRNGADEYDLILMDIDLGSGIDGTLAAKQILEIKDIPVVFLSSHVEPEIVEKTEEITSYGYVVKNSGIVVLDASIKMAMKLFDAKMEQKKAQENIRTSEDRFQRMLGVVPDMISIHDTGMNILFSNWQGFAAVPENKRVLQTKCYKTYRGYNDMCPDCRAVKVLTTGQPVEDVVQLPDGCWFEIRVLPIFDRNKRVEFFVEWVRDISEHKRIEEDLRKGEERFRSFVENANDIVYTLSLDGNFTYISPNWIDFMGEPAEDAIGRSFEHYVYPDDIAICRRFLNEVLLTDMKQSQAEYRVRKKDGTWRWHISNGSPLHDENGFIAEYLGIARDVTELKEATEDLRRKLAEQEREEYDL